MVSIKKRNSVRNILNRGILISLCLSLLIGGGILIAWQVVSRSRNQAYNVNLVQEIVHRDAADLITSSMLKNYVAVAFQLKNSLSALPLKCAYVELAGQRHMLKGSPDECLDVAVNKAVVYREEITSGDISIGPLVYVLESPVLPSGSILYLALAFVALVGSVALSWGVLIKLLNNSIFRPLQRLTIGLRDQDYSPDRKVACDEVTALADQLREFHDQVAASAKREEFERVARMVAHNIKTPVLALEGVDTSGMDDQNRANLRSAVDDIKDMINNLRQQAGASRKETDSAANIKEALVAVAGDSNAVNLSQPVSVEQATVEHLMGLVEMAVSQMRLQYREPYEIDFRLTDGGYRVFSKVQRTEFKCMISNLITNAIEALDGARRTTGHVTIELLESDSTARIVVKDDGPGIAPEHMPKIGDRGFTFGKPKGSGLGLYHAKTTAAAWGGRVQVDSTVGKGTTVTIEVPVAAAPDWFISEVRLPVNGEVAVLDDSPSMQQIWRTRLNSAGFADYPLHYFEIAEVFKAWFRGRAARELLCLVDYELTGQNQNGLDVIEEMGIADISILVTGRYDDPKVQAKAQWVGVGILPKSIIGNTEFVRLA